MEQPDIERVDPYLEAVRNQPAGRTATFAEIARAAGRPNAARAAGRAVARCALDSDVPWHRVVSSDGALAPDPDRAAIQLARLRAEGARPEAGESAASWAVRIGATWIGRWRGRRCARPGDRRAATWPPDRLEPFASLEAAEARGFVDVDEARSQEATSVGATAGTKVSAENSGGS